jgi:addiction module RelB/DinJ family antitoxin
MSTALVGRAGKKGGDHLRKADTVITVRLDARTKERAQEALRGKGLTVSAAVQRLFDYIAKTGNLPFEESKPRFSKEEIAQRLEKFNSLQLSRPLNITDEEAREMRMRDRYADYFDA